MRELAVRGALPAVAALAAVLVALPAPSQAAPSTATYSVSTAGAAVRVVSTQQPAFSIATGDLVDQTLGLVSSSFGSSTSESRAASYYPGDLLAQAGQLICGQFGPCPVEPPAYPLLAEASWPTVRHADVAPAGEGAGVATASADQGANTASTTAAGRSAGGLLVGGITSATSTTVRTDGLHVHVATTLHSIVLGPLGIDSVRVWDDVVIAPDGTRRSSPHVAAAGATVAGTPVVLGAAPLPALAAQGLTVRVVGTDAAGARSGATGVRIDVSVPVRGAGAPVPGLPSLDRTYVGSLVLGQVSVVAARDDALELPVLPLPSVPTSAAVAPPVLGVRQPVALPRSLAPAVPPATAVPAPASSVRLRAFRLDDLDLQGLYAVLALGAVAALGTSRLLTRRAWS